MNLRNKINVTNGVYIKTLKWCCFMIITDKIRKEEDKNYFSVLTLFLYLAFLNECWEEGHVLNIGFIVVEKWIK